MKFSSALKWGFASCLVVALCIVGPKLKKPAVSEKVLTAPYAHLPAIGVRTLQYQDAARKRPIVVELWYPSEANAPLDQPEDAVWVHPEEMRDVPCIDCEEKFPLIMMSHGHGGDRRERSWLADQLVRYGFMVASIDHYGNTTTTFDMASSLKFWERAKDITFAIDRLLEDPLLKEKVDAARIGFVGYSLGGMTGLGLAGAEVDAIERVLQQLPEKYSEIKPEMLKYLDVKQARQSLRDPRIRAAVLICPASFVYSADSLKKVKIPVGLVVAPQDEVLPFKDHAQLIIQHVVPAKLKVMHKAVSHYTFLNRVSEMGKNFVKKHVYGDAPSCDRIVIHQEVGLFAVDFFREFLP